MASSPCVLISNPCGRSRASTTPDPENESLSSSLDNFIKSFYGEVTKTVDEDGNIVWDLPCNLDEGFDGIPRVEGEGLACYWMRVLQPSAQALLKQNNFSDVENVGTARTNLGVGVSDAVSFGSVSAARMTVTDVPAFSTDVVNKGYVDSISAGVDPKAQVRVATTANITLSGAQTVDGVSLTNGDRVLVKDQSATAQNGIYSYNSAGAWSRTTDADTAGELNAGSYYFVTEGSAQAGSGWIITAAPTVLGTDPVVFSIFSQTGTYSAGTGITIVGYTISLAAHATSHKHGGSDEVATATPAANAIPKADGTGKLNAGWIPASVAGDVVGPASSVNNRVALFSGTTGKVLQQSTDPLGTAAFRNISSGGNAGTAEVVTGDDTRLTDSRTPGGIAGGDLTGLYPNPTLPSVVTAGLYQVVQVDAKGRTVGGRNDVVNVKDYGATGNGSTNDTTAIANAVAALPASGGTLYFPSGTFRSGTVSIANKTNLTILGDGYSSSVLKSNASFDAGDGHGVTPGSQVINVASSCSNVVIQGLTFDGNCTHRKAGQQAVVIDADNTTLKDNYVLNSGEYAVSYGRNAPVVGARVINNRIGLNRADGINLYRVTHGLVADNYIDGADDDLIAVGASSDILIVGNTGKSRNDLGSTWGRGIAILAGCTDITISGCDISAVKQYGLYIASEGGTVPTDVRVKSSTFHDCGISSGGCGYIYDTKRVSVEGCNFDNPVTGNCLDIGKWNFLDLKGGRIQQWRNQFCRGVHVDESVVSTQTWSNLSVGGVTINLTGTGNAEGIYIHPDAAHVTMNNVAIYNVLGVCSGAGAANYIDVNASIVGNQGRIVNNITLNGNTVSPSSTTGVITVANNI